MADDSDSIELGEEYSGYAKSRSNGSGGASGASERSVALDVLLWLPSRLLDFVDIFRVDLGAGPANGAVLRLSEHAQMGARFMSPGSLRLGLFGRDYPVRWETGDEYGFGPWYIRSRDRRTGDYELGASFDLLLVGASLGLRFDEFADFFVGIIGVDLLDDDL